MTAARIGQSAPRHHNLCHDLGIGRNSIPGVPPDKSANDSLTGGYRQSPPCH